MKKRQSFIAELEVTSGLYIGLNPKMIIDFRFDDECTYHTFARLYNSNEAMYEGDYGIVENVSVTERDYKYLIANSECYSLKDKKGNSYKPRNAHLLMYYASSINIHRSKVIAETKKTVTLSDQNLDIFSEALDKMYAETEYLDDAKNKIEYVLNEEKL